MTPCPYCRLLPGVERVGRVRPGRVYASWACEGCQQGVDRALATMTILRGFQRGRLHPGILAWGAR